MTRTFKRISKAEFNQYREMARTGHTPTEIASILKIDRKRVQNALYNRGTSYRKELARGIKKNATVEAIRVVNKPQPVAAKEYTLLKETIIFAVALSIYTAIAFYLGGL